MPQSDITALLAHWRDGDRQAFDRMYELVYPELKRIGQQRLASFHPRQTLSATDLVHEAYLKLAGQQQLDWRDRLHFFAVSARAMHHILLNHIESKGAQKRGGDWQRVTFTDALGGPDRDQPLALLQALEKLSTLDERAARVVQLRWFGGLEETEIAEALSVDQRTVRRDWRKARAFLVAALSER